MSPSNPFDFDAALFPGPPFLPPGPQRIVIPLSRVLSFARHESASSPEQRAIALRPLLALALATTGLSQTQSMPPVPAALLPRTAANDLPAGDPELLLTALSSLVEVVKNLTPASGKVFGRLGHEALPSPTSAPRSEVIIELLSIPDESGEIVPRWALPALG
ncbi:MAG: hypothetical protein M3O15_12680, partial [Acidobacteriota bacterium]|nr:hypothetical protein [Acidobacteriota bacterium]